MGGQTTVDLTPHQLLSSQHRHAPMVIEVIVYLSNEQPVKLAVCRQRK